MLKLERLKAFEVHVMWKSVSHFEWLERKEQSVCIKFEWKFENVFLIPIEFKKKKFLPATQWIKINIYQCKFLSLAYAHIKCQQQKKKKKKLINPKTVDKDRIKVKERKKSILWTCEIPLLCLNYAVMMRDGSPKAMTPK